MQNSFNRPIIPPNDQLRLRALEYYCAVNDLPDRYFCNLAYIIAATFNAPIALISLVGETEVYFKGNFGMEGTNKVRRGDSLCSLAILDVEPLVIPDALNERCLLRNPLVAGEFGLRFYAGAPMVTKEGFNIGTVCIVGKEPRDFVEQEKALLVQFANSAMEELESRMKMKGMLVKANL